MPRILPLGTSCRILNARMRILMGMAMCPVP